VTGKREQNRLEMHTVVGDILLRSARRMVSIEKDLFSFARQKGGGAHESLGRKVERSLRELNPTCRSVHTGMVDHKGILYAGA
jgi:hypothetical protein